MLGVMFDSLSAIIEQGANELNIDLPPGSGAAFEAYYDFLESRGQHVNLTAISGAENVVRLHFLDSLALLGIAEFANKKVIDIGSGAGFPGVPLKIAAPSIDLTLMDATKKRVAFLSELCDMLNIKAACYHARAEDAAHAPDKREQYDIVVSRAVSELSILSELCLPFVRVGGFFLAMKGTDSEHEVTQAQRAMKVLDAELHGSRDYKIPGTDIIHRVLLISKTASTPDKYPRRFARIKASPL
jgi:16S rRNA (guanine527-N7)-methyltransferase